MSPYPKQWIALYLPRLPLESFLRAAPAAEPWAVAEDRYVVDCNSVAFAQGVRAGIARAAAAALSPDLRFKERDPVEEQAAVEGIASWAGRFTPNVAVEKTHDSAGVLLEVSGSLKLFKNLPSITAGIAQGMREMGFTPCIGSAPTPSGAWMLARGSASSPCTDLTDLPRRLQALPLDVLECDTRAFATLEAIGLRTVGEVLALPRAGLIQRFGKVFTEKLDRALGIQADARTYFKPPENFRSELEMPYEAKEAGALLYALQRLIVQLGGFLAGRDGGVQNLRIELFHKQARTEVVLGLVRPSRNTEHFMLLVREKLSSLKLKEPVRRLALAADDILSLSHENMDLLDNNLKRPGDWHSLIEHLRAKLGNHAVSGIASEANHRPEAAWRATEPGEHSPGAVFGTRPLWLLKKPKRLEEVGSSPHCDGPLALLTGPERIESGWWDGRDAVRDYFVARSKTDSLLWVYRERAAQEGHWYLHGIFG
jgi:protein ImuB